MKKIFCFLLMALFMQEVYSQSIAESILRGVAQGLQNVAAMRNAQLQQQQQQQQLRQDAYQKGYNSYNSQNQSQTQTNSSEVEELKRQVEELKKQVNSQQNSSGNVSTQVDGVQARQEFKPCFTCGGTRKCHQCTGQGTIVTWAGSNRIEQSCPGCSRSGICPFCHGTGGTYETVYY